MAIIGGGHSVGNAHAAISGFVGGWDISQDAIDNDYFLSLLNRDPVAQVLDFNMDFYQAREIDHDLPHLIELSEVFVGDRSRWRDHTHARSADSRPVADGFQPEHRRRHDDSGWPGRGAAGRDRRTHLRRNPRSSDECTNAGNEQRT